MTVAQLDPDGAATRLAAQGNFALGLGDTAVAAEKYGRAGRLLLADSRRTQKAAERHLLRFVAATQFYLGGHYGEALKYAKQVDSSFLPNFAKPLHQTFLKDAGRRASPSYVPQMREGMAALWMQKKYEVILDRLKDHPFVYAPGPLAFLRANLCENLGHWRAASEFYVQAVVAMPKASPLVIMAAGYAVRLHTSGKLAEAWRYVGELLRVIPGAYSLMAASIVSYWRAMGSTRDERQNRFREQIDYFDRARSVYRELTQAELGDVDVKLFMSLCYDAVLVALMRLGDSQRAVALAGEAIELKPDAPLPLTARGVLTYPSPAAVNDFRNAAELPGTDYVSFYYLAHDAFSRGYLGEAEQLCREALARNPGSRLRSQLTGWLAAFRDSLGAPRGEVETLLRQALEIDPGSKTVAKLYETFHLRWATGTSVKASQWDPQNDEDEQTSPWSVAENSSARWARAPIDMPAFG